MNITVKKWKAECPGKHYFTEPEHPNIFSMQIIGNELLLYTEHLEVDTFTINRVRIRPKVEIHKEFVKLTAKLTPQQRLRILG